MRKMILSRLAFNFLIAIAIVALGLGMQPVRPVYAADITVDTSIDELTTNGLCSLREAIINANNDGPPPPPYPDCAMGTGADTIILQSGTTYTLSLVDTTALGGDLDINDVDGLTIKASGAAPAVIDANDIDRVIQTSTGSGPLTLIGITVKDGNAASGGRGGGIYYGSNTALTLTRSTILSNVATNTSNCGGGIYNASEAAITITDSTFQGNTCTAGGSDGGALWKGASGTLNISGSTFYNNSAMDQGGGIRLHKIPGTITNSTFVGNSVNNLGGAIHVEDGASLSIDFSTFSDNGADNGGGALQVENASATVTRSILANSTAGTDCNQTLGGTVTLTNTLVEDNDNCTEVSVITGDPGLLPLADNGGPTQTMAITNASPAYNAASSCGSMTSDQRGVARPQDGACDLGAYELAVSVSRVILKSVANQDGWILESSETSNLGGTRDNAAATFILGDDAQKKQYRAVLSFYTKGLPDNAAITKVTLRVKRESVVGSGNPVNIFQGFKVDIKEGFFGSAPGLQIIDFQAKADKSMGPFKPALNNGWYSFNLTPARDFINLLSTNGGVTQIRLRFKLDDNNDAIANYLSLYSGNATAASRPRLIIEYSIP